MNDETNYQLKYWKEQMKVARLEGQLELMKSYIAKRNDYVKELEADLLKNIEKMEE
jgi:hypothetical protein